MKKNYVTPRTRVHEVRTANILATSNSTDNPTGSGSSFGGNEQESNGFGSGAFSGLGNPFSGNETEGSK